MSGFRPGGLPGQPDICAIFPPVGKYVGIEVKCGSDRLRGEQIGFHANARRMGAVVLVVRDFEDFQEQIEPLLVLCGIPREI